VALLPLHGFWVNTRGTGSAQFPPSMMLSLLIYNYAVGRMSSRQIEKATYEDVASRYICGGDAHPDHDTICVFRRSYRLCRRREDGAPPHGRRPAGATGAGVSSVSVDRHGRDAPPSADRGRSRRLQEKEGDGFCAESVHAASARLVRGISSPADGPHASISGRSNRRRRERHHSGILTLLLS